MKKIILTLIGIIIFYGLCLYISFKFNPLNWELMNDGSGRIFILIMFLFTELVIWALFETSVHKIIKKIKKLFNGN